MALKRQQDKGKEKPSGDSDNVSVLSVPGMLSLRPNIKIITDFFLCAIVILEPRHFGVQDPWKTLTLTFLLFRGHTRILEFARPCKKVDTNHFSKSSVEEFFVR